MNGYAMYNLYRMAADWIKWNQLVRYVVDTTGHRVVIPWSKKKERKRRQSN